MTTSNPSPPTLLDKLHAINEVLMRRFPDGGDPFRIMTRLLEECGELAEQVNHFEGSGEALQVRRAPKVRRTSEVRRTCAGLRAPLRHRSRAGCVCGSIIPTSIGRCANEAV